MIDGIEATVASHAMMLKLLPIGLAVAAVGIALTAVGVYAQPVRRFRSAARPSLARSWPAGGTFLDMPASTYVLSVTST
ncbi:MAG: hypothetical protein V7637_2642 [Mycobacteriales bacterium]